MHDVLLDEATGYRPTDRLGSGDAAVREALYQRSLPELTAVPGVLAHIEDAHGRVPFAVVSGSTRDSVTASLRTLSLLDRFEVLVCAGDYARAKPDPEAFLLAARLLGVPRSAASSSRTPTSASRPPPRPAWRPSACRSPRSGR